MKSGKAFVWPEELLEEFVRRFRYDPDSGKLFYLISIPGVCSVGQEAGHLHSTGYHCVNVKGKHYKRSRVA